MNAADQIIARELPGIDPAAYPCRLLIRPETLTPDTQVAIVFAPLPWVGDAVAALAATLAEGSAVLLMARDAAELVRKRQVIELLAEPAAGAA